MNNVKLKSFTAAAKPSAFDPLATADDARLANIPPGDRWFHRMDPERQQAYIQLHPLSRFADQVEHQPESGDSGAPSTDVAPTGKKSISDRFVEHIRKTRPTALPHESNKVVGEHIDHLMTNLSPKATKVLMDDMRAEHEDIKAKDHKKKFFGAIGGALLAGVSLALLATPAAPLGEYLGGYAAYKMTGKDPFDHGWLQHQEKEDAKKFRLKDEDFRTPEAFKAAVSDRVKAMAEGFSYNELVKINQMASDAKRSLRPPRRNSPPAQPANPVVDQVDQQRQRVDLNQRVQRLTHDVQRATDPQQRRDLVQRVNDTRRELRDINAPPMRDINPPPRRR